MLVDDVRQTRCSLLPVSTRVLAEVEVRRDPLLGVTQRDGAPQARSLRAGYHCATAVTGLDESEDQVLLGVREWAVHDHDLALAVVVGDELCRI